MGLRIDLLPVSAHYEPHPANQTASLHICGVEVSALADEFGTPLYIYDATTIEEALQAYRQALSQSYPAGAGLTYAGKAYLCTRLAQWMGRHAVWVDCTGASEIAIALAAGLARSAILVHGVTKNREDLQAAMQHAGVIVVDNLDELEQIEHLRKSTTMPDIWLRLRPGVAVDTHSYTQTGDQESKFGLSPGEFLQAVGACLQWNLPLKGIHFHQGSQFRDPSPLGIAIDLALDLLLAAHRETGWQAQFFCPGGGWGVAYHEDDLPHPAIESYVKFIAERLVQGCAARQLPFPHLQLEPGRSLVARAGVALYRIQAVKHSHQRRWLLLDGGMADNPRPALYKARYSALPVKNPDRPTCGAAWLGGPYCESGDVLIEEIFLPDLQAGELLVIPVSGAYHLSMSSNYNGARRPAVVWLEDGHAQLIQRRETIEDLLRRDV